jgi:hypothetical protein
VSLLEQLFLSGSLAFRLNTTCAKSTPHVAHPIKWEDWSNVIPWTSPSREDQLMRLQNEEFDVLVIGGGCVGAGVMLEATRGLKVALVERDDFRPFNKFPALRPFNKPRSGSVYCTQISSLTVRARE